jgi:hypothetical protein
MGLRIFVGGTWQVEKPEKGTCQVEKLQTSPQMNMKPPKQSYQPGCGLRIIFAYHMMDLQNRK